jgi:flagellar protein FliL
MADKKPAAAAPAPEGKKGLPLVPLIGVAVVAAALAGGGAWFFASKGSGGKADGEESGEHAEEGGEEGGEEGAGGGTRYIEMKPAFVVNLSGGAARYLQVEVQLKVGSENAQKQVETHLPAVRNRLMLLLQEVKPEDIQNREAVESLQAKALSEVNGVIEAETERKEVVKELLFTSFVTQ